MRKTEPPKPKASPAKDLPQLELPKDLLDAWQRTVLALARLPRTVRKDLPAPAKLKVVVKQELGEIHDLWEIFTQQRGELSRKLLSSKRLAVDYLLGFHLPNAARAELALTRAEERHGLARTLGTLKGKLVVNDLGAGTAAISQVFTQFLRRRGVTPERMSVHLFDGVGPLLDAARVLFQEAEPQVALHTHRLRIEQIDTERLVKRGPDPVIFAHLLGYVWNELARNTTARTKLARLFEAQAKQGDDALIFLLEPATQQMSREAMTLRDQLVAVGYVPLYPCPKAVECPMLKLSRDWCYSEGGWRRPPTVVQIDEELGIDRSRVNGTMMLLVSPNLATRLELAPEVPGIIVGRPDRTDGKGFDYLICDGELKKVAPPPGKNFLPRGVSLTT